MLWTHYINKYFKRKNIAKSFWDAFPHIKDYLYILNDQEYIILGDILPTDLFFNIQILNGERISDRQIRVFEDYIGKVYSIDEYYKSVSIIDIDIFISRFNLNSSFKFLPNFKIVTKSGLVETISYVTVFDKANVVFLTKKVININGIKNILEMNKILNKSEFKKENGFSDEHIKQHFGKVW